MSILTAILIVFGDVSQWIIAQLADIQTLFWIAGDGDEAQLTFVGLVSLISLGVGLACMLIGIITNFIKFRS